jgi:hypothetical protein
VRRPADYRAFLRITNGQKNDWEAQRLLPWYVLSTYDVLSAYPGWRSTWLDFEEQTMEAFRTGRQGFNCHPKIQLEFFPTTRTPIGTINGLSADTVTMLDINPSPSGTVGQLIMWTGSGGGYGLGYYGPSFEWGLQACVEWLEETNPPTRHEYSPPQLMYVDYSELTTQWIVANEQDALDS